MENLRAAAASARAPPPAYGMGRAKAGSRRAGSWRAAGRPAAAPPRGPQGHTGIAEDSRIVTRSGLVIMREEPAAVVAENLRLRSDMDGEDGEPAAMARRLASPEAKAEGRARGARRGDQDARGRARRGELAGRGEGIRMLGADRAAERALGAPRSWPGAARGSGCSGPTGPPGRREQEARRKRQVPQQLPPPLPLPAAKRYMDGRVPPEKGNRGALRRQAGRRPPGGSREHAGAARKLDTNRPDERRRRPDERSVCRGANLPERHAFAKQQVADIQRSSFRAGTS